MKKFLEQIETYLSFAECEGEPANRAPLHTRAKELLEQMESGRAEFNVLRTYWFFWNGSSSMSVGNGSSPEDAFGKAGYSGGAMRALDYYAVAPYGLDVLNFTTWPEKEEDQRKVLAHIITEMNSALALLTKAKQLGVLDNINYFVLRVEERFSTMHFIHVELHGAYVAAWDAYKKL